MRSIIKTKTYSNEGPTCTCSPEVWEPFHLHDHRHIRYFTTNHTLAASRMVCVWPNTACISELLLLEYNISLQYTHMCSRFTKNEINGLIPFITEIVSAIEYNL